MYGKWHEVHFLYITRKPN